jgi:hemolysin activation/secretion protein
MGWTSQDLSSQAEAGGTEVLGGARSLRGFREYRFVGLLTALVNLELRTRIGQRDFLNQHFAFDLVPFYDTGRIWNEMKDFNFKDYRRNVGIGSRLAWNQSTILRADLAFSTEATQFFFGFSHIF